MFIIHSSDFCYHLSTIFFCEQIVGRVMNCSSGGKRYVLFIVPVQQELFVAIFPWPQSWWDQDVSHKASQRQKRFAFSVKEEWSGRFEAVVCWSFLTAQIQCSAEVCISIISRIYTLLLLNPLVFGFPKYWIFGLFYLKPAPYTRFSPERLSEKRGNALQSSWHVPEPFPFLSYILTRTCHNRYSNCPKISIYCEPDFIELGLHFHSVVFLQEARAPPPIF